MFFSTGPPWQRGEGGHASVAGARWPARRLDRVYTNSTVTVDYVIQEKRRPRASSPNRNKSVVRTLTAPSSGSPPHRGDMFHPQHQASGYAAQPAMPPLAHVGILNPAAAGPSTAPHGQKRSAYVTHYTHRHCLARVHALPLHLAFRPRPVESRRNARQKQSPSDDDC